MNCGRQSSGLGESGDNWEEWSRPRMKRMNVEIDGESEVNRVRMGVEGTVPLPPVC